MRPCGYRWVAVLFFGLMLSGCPVTDDYYLSQNPDALLAASGAGGSTSAQAGTGALAGASSPGGSTAAGAGARGGSGDALSGSAGDANQGGESGSDPACVPSAERCNGRDDDCDGTVDDQACNESSRGTSGCSGFTVSAHPEHGYMFCGGSQRDYSQAKEACAAQGMHLAWLESEEENNLVSASVDAVSRNSEVFIGANDIASEGTWMWDGGAQFWNGNQSGKPVPGMFSAWATGTPNNANNNEDCGVLMASSRTWGDRSCGTKFSYLCEESLP